MDAKVPHSDQGSARVTQATNLEPTSQLSARKMRECVRHTVGWLGLYLLICLSPLVLLALGAPSSRGFWMELGVGLGIVGFAMMALQSLSVARFRSVAPFFGSDAILLFHRQLGVIALLFVLAHPLILFTVEPAFIEYLDPRVNFLRALFLTAATLGVILLVVLPFVRESIALKYEWWRLSHAICAAGVLIVGLVHGLQVGHYLSGWKPAVWIALLLVGLMPIVHVRLVRPWLARNKAYRIDQVREEHGEATTLVLRPDGHQGFAFKAGQFAWLTVGKSPFRLGQHPFSLTGSASDAPEYQMSIKALGDFTSAVPRVPIGSRAYLDGPYGAFSLDAAQPHEGAVLIMGGIGITPAISMLRTCRDRAERRRIILIYANDSWEEVAFREELDVLKGEMDLNVVHVIRSPPEGWQGETGVLRDEVFNRHLPPVGADYHYFVCGPPAMLAIAEKFLVARGVPIWNRSVERFDFV